MKKTLLFISVLAIGGNIVLGQSPRLLLIEECTQASCPPCAAKNPAFNALLNANTAKATSIKYQVSWPGVDPMNAQDPSEIQARAVYTGAYAVGVPFGVDNGGPLTGGQWLGDPSALTQFKIDSAQAIPSPFTMVLQHWFNTANDSIFIKCTITCSQAVSMSTPTFQVAILEKLITFANPPGANGEKTFEHVMRKMYPDAYGTQLATSWTLGQTQTLTFKEPIPSYIYKKTEIATIAWIQDDGNKNIKQAAYSPTPYATGINEVNLVNLVNTISVYPNPGNGIFTASFESLATDSYTVKITNTLGQTVYEEALNNFNGAYSKELNISSFGKGIYTLSISDSKNVVAKKVITY
jgi:hypothetical protein